MNISSKLFLVVGAFVALGLGIGVLSATADENKTSITATEQATTTTNEVIKAEAILNVETTLKASADDSVEETETPGNSSSTTIDPTAEQLTKTSTTENVTTTVVQLERSTTTTEKQKQSTTSTTQAPSTTSTLMKITIPLSSTTTQTTFEPSTTSTTSNQIRILQINGTIQEVFTNCGAHLSSSNTGNLVINNPHVGCDNISWVKVEGLYIQTASGQAREPENSFDKHSINGTKPVPGMQVKATVIQRTSRAAFSLNCYVCGLERR